MATVALQPDVMTEAGVAATYTAPLVANTYTFRNNGKTLLHIKKGANACNVTIASPKIVHGHAVAGDVVAVPATSERFIGPFDHEVYDDVNHDVSVTFSEVTGLTVAVIQIP